MTVSWHVDDLKVSRANEKEVDKFADYLRGLYEKTSLISGLVTTTVPFATIFTIFVTEPRIGVKFSL